MSREAERLMRAEKSAEGTLAEATLALSLQRQGEALTGLRRGPESVAALREALAIREAISQKPSQWPTRELRQISTVLRSLGPALLLSGSAQEARSAHERGAGLERGMLERYATRTGRNHGRTETMWYLSAHLLGEARARLALGDPAGARPLLREALGISRELVLLNDSNIRAYRTLAAVLDATAEAEWRTGDRPAARAHAEEAVRQIRHAATVQGAGRAVRSEQAAIERRAREFR